MAPNLRASSMEVTTRFAIERAVDGVIEHLIENYSSSLYAQAMELNLMFCHRIMQFRIFEYYRIRNLLGTFWHLGPSAVGDSAILFVRTNNLFDFETAAVVIGNRCRKSLAFVNLRVAAL
jgi:hypothetical protein